VDSFTSTTAPHKRISAPHTIDVTSRAASPNANAPQCACPDAGRPRVLSLYIGGDSDAIDEDQNRPKPARNRVNAPCGVPKLGSAWKSGSPRPANGVLAPHTVELRDDLALLVRDCDRVAAVPRPGLGGNAEPSGPASDPVTRGKNCASSRARRQPRPRQPGQPLRRRPAADANDRRPRPAVRPRTLGSRQVWRPRPAPVPVRDKPDGGTRERRRLPGLETHLLPGRRIPASRPTDARSRNLARTGQRTPNDDVQILRHRTRHHRRGRTTQLRTDQAVLTASACIDPAALEVRAGVLPVSRPRHPGRHSGVASPASSLAAGAVERYGVALHGALRDALRRPL
jgi:hypothetical protein